MSGIEAIAGLAVGILPLMISAAEHYEDCLRPFIRYKNFTKEADRFRSQLGTQKVIFKNQCRILLEAVLSHDVASGMLATGPEHPSWSDLELERQLCELLNESKDACIATVEMIGEHLREIEKEAQDLESVIKEDSQGCTDVIGSKPWRRRVAKKLRFSLSKPRLEKVLSTLRYLNDDFRILSSQTLKSKSSGSQKQPTICQASRQEIQKYQIIGQASRQVYEALGKACTKHTEHQARFCVEVEQAIINGDHNAQIKFNVAFTHLQLASASDQNDLIWFVVDSTRGEDRKNGTEDIRNSTNHCFTDSLKRQLEPALCSGQKRPKKSVRFESSVIPAPCIPSDAASACAFLSHDHMRKDFCDFLRRRLRKQPKANECMGVLENNPNCRNFVYPPPATSSDLRRQFLTLYQLISNIVKDPHVGRISLYYRLRLAKILATTVLQYHSTPWLKESWRSEDVYFFGDDSTAAQETPGPASLHLSVRVKEPSGQLSRASMFPPHNLARNTLLFSLGVLFLEIAYTSTIENLQRPVDLENGRENRYTEFFAARRLSKAAKTDMGGKYHKIVEKLIECDFGCGTDLNDALLQTAFYNEVICPLEDLERKLHDIHLD